MTSYPAEPAPTFIFRQDEVWRLREQLLNASHLTRVLSLHDEDLMMQVGTGGVFFFFEENMSL